MKILCLVFYAAAICFCIAGFIGHSTAWAAAAICLFAAIMIIIGQRKNKK